MTLERVMERKVNLAHAAVVRSDAGEVTLSYGAGTEVSCAVGTWKDDSSSEEHARAVRSVLVCYFPPSTDLRTSPPDRVTVEGTDYEIASVERVERAGKLRALKARLERVE